MIRLKCTLFLYWLAQFSWFSLIISRFITILNILQTRKKNYFSQKNIQLWKKYIGLRFFFHKSIVFCAVFTLSFIYRVAIRPWLSGGCRFYPTCSAYGIQAFQQHSLFRAIYLILRRVVRCHPWGLCAVDPVPPSPFSSRS